VVCFKVFREVENPDVCGTMVTSGICSEVCHKEARRKTHESEVRKGIKKEVK